MLLPFLWFALCAGSLPAQLPGQNKDFQSVKIIETTTPAFPEDLIPTYHNGGYARVEISVTEEGKLGEWLVTGYTHRRFADAALEAIKDWAYEPARLMGEPISVSITLTFNFEVKGVVISSTGADLIAARFAEMLGERDAYTTCTLRELDRIPVPRNTVVPAYPKTLADRGVHGEVTVEFYIDEQGTVRMPFVVGRPDNTLANLAVDAVRQWSFEPPTRDGRPVMVHVRQPFRFKPTAPAVPAEATAGL